MLTRRGFFGRLVGAFAAALASPTLAATLRHTAGSFGAPPLVTPALRFHPNAFAIVMRPLTRDASVPCAYCLRMAVDHCRKRGCLRDWYYRGSIADLPAGFDWYQEPSL